MRATLKDKSACARVLIIEDLLPTCLEKDQELGIGRYGDLLRQHP